MARSMRLYSRMLDHSMKSTSLTKAEAVLFVVGVLVQSGAWTLTTITSGWLYVAFCAIGVTVAFLAGLLAIGFVVRQIIWTIHHGPASMYWPWTGT